jgi:small neutral amino acid transporter SnatA (MarC family)
VCIAGEEMTTASPAIRHTTTPALAGVGLITAIVSYSHMQQLGLHHGRAWRSFLIPLSIDGLMAAASMVLLSAQTARSSD